AAAVAAQRVMDGPYRLAVASFDYRMALRLHALSCPFLDYLLGAVGWTGEMGPMTAASASTTLYLVWRPRYHTATSSGIPPPTARRQRPDYWFVHALADLGYPGGHVMNAVVMAGVVLAASLPRLRTRWQRAAAVAFWICFVAATWASRVYFSAHFTTDN